MSLFQKIIKTKKFQKKKYRELPGRAGSTLAGDWGAGRQVGPWDKNRSGELPFPTPYKSLRIRNCGIPAIKNI